MTTTTRERQRSRNDLANATALASLVALGIGYAAMFSVLGDSNFAVKFETGEFAPGFDAAGGQTAAIISACAALCAVVGVAAAASVRTTKLVGVIAVVGLLGIVPYVPLALLTWGLAF